MGFRTDETEATYQELLKSGAIERQCPLCEREPLHAFRYWKVIENHFPYDKITKLHEMIVPYRHVNEVETIIASRLLWCYFEKHQAHCEQMYGSPARNENGQLTGSGVELLHGLAGDLAWVIAKLASVRERRIQLCLATAIVGPGAVKEAAEKFGGYKREMLLRSIYSWLGTSVNDQGFRKKIVDYVAENGSDEHIEIFASRLVGTSFLGECLVQEMFWEIFDKEEHINF